MSSTIPAKSFFSNISARRTQHSQSRPTGMSRSRVTGTGSTPTRTCYAPGQTLFNSPVSPAQFDMQSQSFPNNSLYSVSSPFDDGNNEDEDDSMFSSPNNQLSPVVDYSQLCFLVQEQQSLLRTIMCSQETLKKGQDELKQHQRNTDERLVELEKKIACSETSSGGSTVSERKRTGKDLSDKVTVIYDSFEIDQQFNLEESSTTKHNASVKSEILEQIVSVQDCKHSPTAVQRKYENLRRIMRFEEKENCLELKSELKKKEQKYENRKLVTATAEEVAMWSELDLQYITEESDNPDTGAMVSHKLSWRSETLDKIVKTLDERYQKKVQSEGGVIMARRNRTVGDCSDSLPPSNAPEWAIDSAYSQQDEVLD